VNLDVGFNSYEFSHILASFRMQPLMAAKSWLVSGCSRQQITVRVAYVSVTCVN
jgi:hypothetical protein